MKNKEQEKNVISQEIALSELVDFMNEYSLLPTDSDEITENTDLKIVLLAIQKGLLKFEDHIPVYTLRNPLQNDKGEQSVIEVTFKTRIFPKELIKLSKGINVSKDPMSFSLRCIAYLCGESESIVNKFSKFDYSVVQQISTVFM